MLFSSQSNFWELVLFSLSGFGFGMIFSLLKPHRVCKKPVNMKSAVFRNSVFFATFAISVVALSVQIPFYQMGYQTFLVPLLTFYLAKTAFE